ncbi:MAG: hypothetical protein NC319_02050 [Butyricicoccus sp.]|nr:hypothetical protein [Butyricicoccus sp.]
MTILFWRRRYPVWYSLQKKDLSDEDKNYLDGSLVECCRRYGITFDNATITDKDGNFREMLIIPDCRAAGILPRPGYLTL